MNQKELINLLQENFDKGIISLYQELLPGFQRFAGRYSTDRELCKQAYHDAIIAFIEIWNDGKYDPNKGQMNTLIYTIGKNQILKRLNQDKIKTEDLDKIFGLPCELEKIKLSEDEQGMLVALNKMGAKCQQIIRLFFYLNYSNEAIMHTMNYENENTVKAQKSRCLKQLKTLTISNMKSSNL